MTESAHELSRNSRPSPSAGAHRRHDRAAPPSHPRADLVAPGLPPELAFLAAEGFAPEHLLNAMSAAPRSVRPADQLLSDGKITEEVYYRALAAHLGCQYYCGEPPLAQAFDAVKALRCGVAPLEPRSAGPRIVIAPRVRFVPQLIEATLSGAIRSGSFALTSPQRFATLVRAYRADELFDVALGRLPASLTARQGMTGLQSAAFAATAILALALGVADFDALQAVSSAMLWLIFSASVMLRSMAAVANRAEVHPPELTDDELPNYTVIVALYRETGVVTDLIKAIDAFDYPKSKLDIKLVVEQRDFETLGLIVELSLPARYEVIVAPPGAPQTKPRALNIALAGARGDLVVVYDAEDNPAPDQLRLAASRFAADKDLDCLQARLAIRNHGESWLSRLFAVEYAILFDVINPGLCALNLPIPLGGSSNHFRIGSLVGVGAWDEWNVTEDADLGVRLARFSYRVRSLDSDTSEEAPYELGNWFRQRVRWQKGWMRLVKGNSFRRNCKTLTRNSINYRRSSQHRRNKLLRSRVLHLPPVTQAIPGDIPAQRWVFTTPATTIRFELLCARHRTSDIRLDTWCTRRPAARSTRSARRNAAMAVLAIQSITAGRALTTAAWNNGIKPVPAFGYNPTHLVQLTSTTNL
jgi:hypothetical protein